jgi:hypothetical protein
MKKFVNQIVLAPHGGWHSDPTDPHCCQISNHSNKDLSFTVERFVDPIADLIKYVEGQLEMYKADTPSFMYGPLFHECVELLKDAKDAHKGTK